MFANKVFLITGASSGIGADAARHLAALSAQLVLVGRNAENLEKTAEICRNRGPRPLTVVADVTKDLDLERVIENTKKHYGKLDVLVNNAGISALDNILNLNMETYDQVMNTNLRSIFNLTRLAVPLLLESKGNIINISSALGVKPSFNILSYSISKAALNSFTRAIALHLASKKVRVNSIVLGYAKTDIYNRSGVDQKMEEAISKAIPLREPIQVEDVSKLIAYLASDDAKSITGHYVAIDGGVNAM